MKIKPAICKINKTQQTTVAIEGDNTYNDLSTKNELTNKNIEQLCSTIETLSQDDQYKIYILMRTNGIDEEYFSKSNKGVYFEFYKLNKDLKQKIFKFVQLTIENNNRNKEIEQLSNLNDNNLKKFEESLLNNKPKINNI